MKKWISSLLIIAMVLVGCSPSEVVDEKDANIPVAIEEETENREAEDQEAEDQAEENQLEEVEHILPPTEAQEALREEFLTYVKTAPGLVNVRQYVTDHIEDADQGLADDMLFELVAHAKFDVYDEVDLVFQEDNVGMHMAVFEIYRDHYQAFDGSGMILGQEAKDALLRLMGDSDYRALLIDLFNQGYGLVMAEGAYYPEMDYVGLLEAYKPYLSSMMVRYLEILGESQLNPTTNEEYLAISFEQLVDRAVEAEQFLMDYPDMTKVFKQDVGNVLMTCIWKLSGPNIFDGMLSEEFLLTVEVEATYRRIIEEEPTPIVTSTAKSLMSWIDTKEGGQLGSMDNMDEMYQVYNEVFTGSVAMMDDLYPMQ